VKDGGNNHMKKIIAIISATFKENKLWLTVNESLKGLQPAEQILVDSEHYSFIYLMEDLADYTYITLQEDLWPALKTALDQKISIWATFKEEQIELTNLIDELEYIISNIKGNSNYGKEMVTRVEKLFLA
jgi:hypothetical protein